MAGTITKFVSQKINKIRWRPTSKQVIQESKVFATGSWDNDVNRVGIWSLESPPGEFGEEDEFAQNLEGEPQLLCETEHIGDTTDLRYMTGEHIVASSSNGSVVLYRHHTNSQTLSVTHTWERLHHQGADQCSCTALATKGEETVVSVGEDGRIVVLNIDQRQPVRTIDKADSCTLHGVTFLKQFEIAAVNSIGQLKVWDLRQPADEPTRIFHLAGERLPLHCLDKHPTQPHILATGGQEGTLCIWDMRQDKFPVTLLSAHSADMWEVRFHPSHPDNLFSCSEDGTAWHWDATSIHSATVNLHSKPTGNTTVNMTTLAPPSKHNSSYTSPWLASEASKHRLEVTDLLPGNTMPVNSIDIETNTLLCGTDSEQIYVVKNLAIR